MIDARTITITSGILLLAVFALAGWASKRRRNRREQERLENGTSRDD